MKRLVKLDLSEARAFVRTKLLERYGTYIAAGEALNMDYYALKRTLIPSSAAPIRKHVSAHVGAEYREDYVTPDGEVLDRDAATQYIRDTIKSRGLSLNDVEEQVGMGHNWATRRLCNYNGTPLPEKLYSFVGMTREIYYLVEKETEMSKRDFVLDLETMGRGPNAPVMSIGLVSLDRTTGAVGTHAFYVVVEPNSACSHGAQVTGDTINWWLTQSDEARAAVTGDGAKELPSAQMAAAHLISFLENPDAEEGKEFDDVVLWGNGPSFDCGILGSMFDRLGYKRPWQFWNERCYRTMLDLYPEAKSPFGQDRIQHHALHDATHEAEILAECFRIHNSRVVAGQDEEG